MSTKYEEVGKEGDAASSPEASATKRGLLCSRIETWEKPKPNQESKTTSSSTDKNCRVFVISTEQEKNYYDRLVVQLYHLLDRGYIESWGSLSSTSSSSSPHGVSTTMESSSVFLLLISPDFIAAKSIRQNQVAYATKRAKEGTAVVISILVRAVHWSELPALNQFQALPSNLIPVMRWGDDQDEAWLDIQKGIIQAIQIFKGEASISAMSHPNPIPGRRSSAAYDGDSCSAASTSSFDTSSFTFIRRESLQLSSRNEPSLELVNETSPQKVFISYVPEDIEYRDRLEIQLHHLVECRYIESWTDVKILRSTDWESCVRPAMDSATIFLLLVSPDYIVNKFILQNHVNHAIHRAENGSAQIISIIVRHVNWPELPSLNKYQALPPSLFPVQKWEDQDEAWLVIEKGIIQAVRVFNGEESLSVILNPNPISGVHDDDAQSHRTPLGHIIIPSMSRIDECEIEFDNNKNTPSIEKQQPRVGSQQQLVEKKCKVFISYSHKDPQYRDRLELQLRHLHDRGFIDCWSDNQILPGMDWHSTIQNAMEDADVFLLLVSPDFVASRFIMEEEVPYATNRAEVKKDAQVIAIVVRSVHWSDLPALNRFQAFPSNLRPIRQWKDQDEAWLDVEKGVIQAIRVFTGDVVDTFATMASPALQAMRALSSSSLSSSSSVGGDSVSELGSTISPSLFSSKDPPLHFHRITDFWKTDIPVGRLVSLNCTLSRYAPMAIGSPFKKRDSHLCFRKLMSDPNWKKRTNTEEAMLNSLLSFTAGQMAWSIDFEELPWQFLGLYQSIIRNSIPLFIHQDYYRNFVEKLFQTGKTFDAHVVARVFRLPDDFSALFADDKLIGTNVVKPTILDRGSRDDEERPVYGLLVDPTEDESSSVSFREAATYLDGDIWVAIQSNEGGRSSKTSIHTRFCNLADENDIAGQINDLKEELEEKYPQGYRVVFEFDQLERRFEGAQKLETQEMVQIVFEQEERRFDGVQKRGKQETMGIIFESK